MATFSAAQIIDKTLKAKTQLNVYKLPNAIPANKIGIIQKGGIVGTVYSYVEVAGALYWMFKDSYGRNYYVKHATGAFDVLNIKSQGAFTVQEELSAAERAKMSELEKLAEKAKDAVSSGADALNTTIKKTLFYAGLVLVGYFIVKKEVKSSKILEKF